MEINLTHIILALTALVGAALTYYIIPLLRVKAEEAKEKLSENQQILLKTLIQTGVKAAEQIFRSDEGQKKKHYVLSLLEAQGYKIDSTAIDAAIEAAVKDLKIELAK